MDVIGRPVIGKESLQVRRSFVVERAQRGPKSILLVACEKGMQQNTLIWKEEVGAHQVSRIVVRKIDIVKVDPTTHGKPRKDFQDEVINLTARFDCMRGVDEQQAVILQISEHIQFDQLSFLGDKLDLAVLMCVSQEPIGKWVDTDYLRSVACFLRRQKDDGG